MKLILTQEVDGLGSAGDVVDVKSGYARNYLVPRGFGVHWTRGGQKMVDSLKSARSARAVRDQEHAEQVKATLEANPVSVSVKAGESGRLFGAVTPAEIAGAMHEKTGEDVDKRTLVLGNPIKSLGAHTVGVRLHEEVTATVTLNVIPA